MITRNLFNHIILALGVSCYIVTSAWAGPTLPINGNFDYDFTNGINVNNGWVTSDPEKFVLRWTTDGWTDLPPGKAWFLPDQDGSIEHSTLSQVFTFDDSGSKVLSFDIDLVVTGTIYETDVFTASLLNLSGDTPAEWQDFYTLSSDEVDPTLKKIHATGTLYFSSLSGQTVNLVFDLHHNYEDVVDTSVYLDNVQISDVPAVPAPSSILLEFLGSGIIVITSLKPKLQKLKKCICHF